MKRDNHNQIFTHEEFPLTFGCKKGFTENKNDRC